MANKLNWPENLYCAVFQSNSYTNFPPDVEESINYVMNDLSLREKIVIIEKFYFRESLAEIGRKLSVTGTRVVQNEKRALYKMRKEHRSIYLSEGLKIASAILKAKARHAIADPCKLKSMSLESLALNVRTYNALKRAGHNNLYDIASKKKSELLKIRNLGVKCVYELMDKCEEYGVYIEDDH